MKLWNQLCPHCQAEEVHQYNGSFQARLWDGTTGWLYGTHFRCHACTRGWYGVGFAA